MDKDKRISTITKLLSKCKASRLTTEKDIIEIPASKFFSFSKEQRITDEEANLFFELQEALKNKALFSFLMGEQN
ncbi:MAG: hypothetical protein ACI3VU_09100 [Faecousia sp.]